MTSANTTQEDFWFRNDDGSLTGATYMGAQNSDQSIDSGIKFRLRIIIEENNGKNDPWSFQLGAQKNGSGGYTLVTTTRTDGIRYVDDDNAIADGSIIATADFDLTWTGTPEDGEYDDAQSAAGMGTIQLNGSYTEIEFCVVMDGVNLSDGDYFDFHVLDTGGGAIDGYNRTPRVTAVVGAAPVTVNAGYATLASSAQALDAVPGGVSVGLGAVTLASSPQAMENVTSQPPAQIVPMAAVTLVSSAQTTAVLPGAVSIPMSEAILSGAPQTANVIPPPVLVPVFAVTLASSPQSINVTAGAANESPGVVLNTPDQTTFLDTNLPTVEFTGTDPETEDIRYNIQISDDISFRSGVTLADSHTTGIP
jgi:hypothetical protein